jgi:L,D-transpeptidase ErfK/SrfK
MSRSRQTGLLLALALLAACSTRAPLPAPPAPVQLVAPLPPVAMLQSPIDTHRFEIESNDDVLGTLQRVIASRDDTLPDIARRFNVGYEEIVRVNPGVDPWLPGEGREIIVPTRFVLPNAPREGLVINIAAMRLFYFAPPVAGRKQVVYTHPIGIGKVGWSTPEGSTRITGRQKNPVWIPPASVRKEHLANGERLPAAVPAGPDNPLGRYKFTLGWPSYLIHGTNKPYGVGLRSSHGCLRLYPEDIEALYDSVPVGTVVRVVNQPFVLGWHDGRLQLQAFNVLEDDRRDWRAANTKLLQKVLTPRIEQQLKSQAQTVDWVALMHQAQAATGLPMPVGQVASDSKAVLADAPRVINRIPAGSNWDGRDEIAAAAQQDIRQMVAERQKPVKRSP